MYLWSYIFKLKLKKCKKISFNVYLSIKTITNNFQKKQRDFIFFNILILMYIEDFYLYSQYHKSVVSVKYYTICICDVFL